MKKIIIFIFMLLLMAIPTLSKPNITTIEKRLDGTSAFINVSTNLSNADIDELKFETNATLTGNYINVTIGGKNTILLIPFLNNSDGKEDTFFRNYAMNQTNLSCTSGNCPTGNKTNSWFNGTKSFGFDNSNDQINIPTNAQTTGGTNQYQFEAWINVTDVADHNGISARGDNLDNEYTFHCLAGGELRLTFDGQAELIETGACANNRQDYVSFAATGATTTIYMNGIAVDSQVNTGTFDDVGGDNFWIGRRSGGGVTFFHGLIGFPKIYRRAYPNQFNLSKMLHSFGYDSTTNSYFINHTNVSRSADVWRVCLNDSRNGEMNCTGWQTFQAAAPPVIEIINNTKPVINISYPAEGETIDNSTSFPLILNGTITVQNGSIANFTINDTNWKNLGNSTNFNFTFNGTFREGIWVINFTANSTYGNQTSTALTFTIDVTGPNVVSSLDSNYSLFHGHENMTFEINVTDNIKLYSFNLSTPEGFLFNRSGLNTTKFVFNGSINISAYNVSKHNITAEFCDAHTSRNIDDWNFKKNLLRKELRYDFGSSFFHIRPQDPNLISDFDTEKKTDRYIFKFSKSPLNKKNIYSFVVESSEFIDIIGNENYNGWLVIPSMKKWIDFNLQNENNADYNITRLASNRILVSISNILRDDLVFESAGDLNCDKKTWIYYVFNYTAFFTDSVVETTTDLITLQIDFKDIVLNGNGTLNYSNIKYNTTNYTSSNQLNLTINFTVPNVPYNATNVTFLFDFFLNTSSFKTKNYTQLVNRIRIASCGADTEVRTLNISIFNEQNINQYLVASVDSVFTIWTNNSGNTVNFTFDFDGATNYSICIFPNTSINVDAYLLYNTTDGFTQRWFLTNARLTTNTSLLHIYNFNSQTGISALKGIVRSQSFEVFPLIITKLQRYYVTENLWRTVQMDKSDQFGQVLFNIIETTTDYRLIFEKDGSEYDRTSSVKFKCTSSLCSLDFVIINRTTETSAQLYFNYAYNNASEMFQLNFSDSSGLTNSVRLKITQDLSNQSITICDTTLSTSSGTINCNTTGYSGTLTVRVYSSSSPEVAKIIVTIIKKIGQKLYEIIDRNEAGFWSSGILITLTLAGFIYTPVAGIIFFIASLVGLFYLGTVNFITITLISILSVMGITISLLLKRK